MDLLALPDQDAAFQRLRRASAIVTFGAARQRSLGNPLAASLVALDYLDDRLVESIDAGSADNSRLLAQALLANDIFHQRSHDCPPHYRHILAAHDRVRARLLQLSARPAQLDVIDYMTAPEALRQCVELVHAVRKPPALASGVNPPACRAPTDVGTGDGRSLVDSYARVMHHCLLWRAAAHRTDPADHSLSERDSGDLFPLLEAADANAQLQVGRALLDVCDGDLAILLLLPLARLDLQASSLRALAADLADRVPANNVIQRRAAFINSTIIPCLADHSLPVPPVLSLAASLSQLLVAIDCP
jgi:hypothetical protein